MAHFRFPSIAHPSKYGYMFDSSAWKTSETHSSFRQYETYGDDLIQHSGDWSVTLEYLSDYLHSLGAAMLASNVLTDAVSYIVTRRPDVEDIAFAASVAWKESDVNWDKRRYYSVNLRKISGRAKEHDKRFTEITRYDDGSRASIFRLITSEYANGLERFQNAEAVREWADAQKKYIEHGENFPEWFGGDRHKKAGLRDALFVCRYIAEARQRFQNAELVLEHYRHSVSVDAAEAAKAADTIPDTLAS